MKHMKQLEPVDSRIKSGGEQYDWAAFQSIGQPVIELMTTDTQELIDFIDSFPNTQN